MKKLIVLAIAIFTIGAVFNYTGDKQPKRLNDVKENGQNMSVTNKLPVPYQQSLTIDTNGAVPTFTNFYDYRTNGNNLRLLWVIGDTILIASDLVDSANCQVSTARKSYYQASFDGGVSWLSDAVLVNTAGNAYPDLCPIILTGARSVAITGRQFVAGVRNGYVGVEVALGAGSITSTLNGGQEIFSMNLTPILLCGGYESKTTDSLYSAQFNVVTNTYLNRVLLATSADGIAANTRSFSAAASNRAATAWWDPAAGDLWVRVSTNGGVSFAPKVIAISSTSIINGDPCCSWFGTDILFSPTGNVCVATSTLEQGFFGTPRGSKMVFWSPAINGGSPVVIVDYHNAPSNCMLSDTTYYDNHYDPNFHQVGCVALSHASLAYSSDGSRLFCVYSVVQKDTVDYRFFYNDICESYSDNNGATWSAPVKLTNTTAADELYPTISRTGCTPTNIAVTFQLSECPGSTSFTNTTTPACKVYNVFRRFNPVTGAQLPIGIKNIGSEIPKDYSLSQNYPNPFNPETKIRFALPKTSNVTLKVYDITGRLVSVLVNNEAVEAGLKEVNFNASNIASGIYFYTINADNFTETKKMILVK